MNVSSCKVHCDNLHLPVKPIAQPDTPTTCWGKIKKSVLKGCKLISNICGRIVKITYIGCKYIVTIAAIIAANCVLCTIIPLVGIFGIGEYVLTGHIVTAKRIDKLVDELLTKLQDLYFSI